jgi:hypothetical protein
VDRHTRSTDGSGYHYFRNPQGVRFRSKVEAAKHYGVYDAFGDAASKEKNKAKQTKKNESAVSVAAPLAVSAFVGDAKNTKKKKKEKEKRGGQQDRPVDGELLLLGDAEKKKKKKKKKKPRTPWEYVKVDGEVFRRGDCAYVISDKTIDLDDDAEEICAACGTTHGPSGVTQSRNEGEGEGEGDVMLECDGCLRGWHLGCLTPPLLEVPDAEWVCPMCLASEDGVAAPDERTRKRTACSEFLDGRLHLCRIENIWSEGSEFKFVGRWFATPEETHTGRRSHHARREVFLTGVTDENNVDALLKRATVLPPQQFRDAARHAAKAASAARRRAVAAKTAAGEGDLNRVAETAVAANENDDEDSVDAAAVAAARAAGEDVFLCEYTYDAHFQRFKRRNEWEDDEFSDDEGRGRSGRLARGEERYLDDDDFGDDSDASDAPEDEDDGGEWNAARRKNGKKNANKSGKSNKRALRGRAVSRHITASRRKAAAASGEAGVMGLGAMAIRVVEREAPATKLSRARVALSLATTPGSMPCREHERAKIYDFVEQAINEGSACRGRSMYISGVPGTGKTATVREVIRALRKKSRDGYLPRFNHVELNGLRLQTPKHAYSAIAEELLGERLGPDRACEVLDARFRDGRGADGTRDGSRRGRDGPSRHALIVFAVQPLRLAHAPRVAAGHLRNRQHAGPPRALNAEDLVPAREQQGGVQALHRRAAQKNRTRQARRRAFDEVEYSRSRRTLGSSRNNVGTSTKERRRRKKRLGVRGCRRRARFQEGGCRLGRRAARPRALPPRRRARRDARREELRRGGDCSLKRRRSLRGGCRARPPPPPRRGAGQSAGGDAAHQGCHVRDVPVAAHAHARGGEPPRPHLPLRFTFRAARERRHRGARVKRHAQARAAVPGARRA